MNLSFKEFLLEQEYRMFKLNGEGEEDYPSDDTIVSTDVNDEDPDMDAMDSEDMGPGEEVEPEDPDKQGMIRVVNGAHLVYKRKQDDGTYEELWQYKIKDHDMRNEVEVRHDILNGTDIPVDKTRSEDGTQRYELTTMGDAQLLRITGLPN